MQSCNTCKGGWIWLWMGALLLLPQLVKGQPCATLQRDTLLDHSFEDGLPEGWQAERSSDGGRWQVNQGRIGYYENPGSGNWLYVNDEPFNNIGRAVALSPLLDLREYDGEVEVSFDMLFQEYADSSYLLLELWDGHRWHELSRDTVDFFGTVILDLSEFAGRQVQLRWTYDDEGAWAWGMGLDNFLVQARQSQCGNGLCDPGETPQLCSEDCSYQAEPAPAWVPLGQDLTGQPVTYRAFKGGTRCDDCSEEIDLPFELDFYGHPYQTVHLNANGNLTFGTAYKEYTPQPFCLDGPEMVAPFYADLDLSHGGHIDYYLDPEGHYLIVTWTEVPFFGCEDRCELRNTFQLVLTDGSISAIQGYQVPARATAIFNYGDMQWTTGSSSGGIGGFGGSAATVGINAGNGELCHDLGAFDQPGFMYYGSSLGGACPPSAVSYLDYRTFAVNTTTGDWLTEGEASLPPTLSLQVEIQPESNELTWTLNGNTQVRHFVIDRSGNGEEFALMAKIEPGASQAWQEYRYQDTAPFPRFNYYRIYLVDETGASVYSNVVTVERSPPERPRGPALTLLQVGPNPLQAVLDVTFQTPQPGEVTYQLVDMGGRSLQQGSLTIDDTEGTLRLNVDDLPAGSYVFVLQQGDLKAYRTLLKKE